MYLGFYMFSTIATIQISIIYAQTDTAACNSCCTAGVPGIPGQHGNPGVSGPQGMNGVKGEQGLKGEQGMKGYYGSNGLDGIPGKLGPTGPQGLTGLPGSNGVKGEKGEQAVQRKSAFSVVFTSDPGRLDHTSPMKYDTIITKVGNDYNNETGKFVCAIPGVYVFQVNSMKINGRSNVVTKIMKNGNSQVSVWASADGYNSASTMVVLDLVSGDQVWTQPQDLSTNNYKSNGNGYCSFSGFLLYAA